MVYRENTNEKGINYDRKLERKKERKRVKKKNK